MVPINLYQAGKLNLTLDFPTSWNELLPAEVLNICKSLLLQKEENTGATRANILKHLIESRTAKSKKKLPPAWMTIVDAEQAVINGYPLLDFIFTENELTTEPSFIKLTYRLISYSFFPVSFAHITCGEYEDCEMKAFEFQQNPSGELLASIAAILFRPKDKEGLVPYMKFNQRTNSYYSYKWEKKVNHFLKLKPEQLYAIYVWYCGSRNQLPKMFEDVYEGGESGEPDMLAFTNCIHSGAGPKNGSREKIRTMKLNEFMYDMNQEAIKAKQLQEEYDKIAASNK